MIFHVFFLILGANPCCKVINGGLDVNVRYMGKIDKEKTVINEHKLA